MSLLPLSHFNSLHEGEPGFVIGGGPSLLDVTDTHMDILKTKITIGSNKAYKLFTPKYLVWVDGNFYNLFYRELTPLECVKFTKRKWDDPKSNIYGLPCDWENYSKGNYLVPNSFGGDFTFPNSGAFGLIIAHLLGCNPIYLMGIDLKMDGDKTHFHDDYYKKDMVRLAKEVGVYERMFCAFRAVINTLNDRNVQVYTTTPGTRLERIIKYVDLGSVLL